MFHGFSPETIDFLWGIRMNNNREWFLEHKQQYVLTLYEPMKELAKEISRPFVNIPGFLCKTSRIYRDMRMHPDTPYKESLWICLRQEGSWWQQEPSLFFELTPDQYSYGFLWWQPAVAMMNGFRQDILQHSDVFLKMVRKAERESGMTVSGRSYVRKKTCENKSVDPYYQLRNIVAYREENGPFTSRAQLKKVPKLGPKAFQQCAGFLRVIGGREMLDNTGVHPESYAIAEDLIKRFGYSMDDVVDMYPHRPEDKQPTSPDPLNNSAEWLPNKAGISIGFLLFNKE